MNNQYNNYGYGNGYDQDNKKRNIIILIVIIIILLFIGLITTGVLLLKRDDRGDGHPPHDRPNYPSIQPTLTHFNQIEMLGKDILENIKYILRLLIL